ncbi:FAS1-like dehydratase domain-containing protein [Nocardioides marmoriginsengisoli]|uniref:FAS1-like dehydratase domain-containing protein n=1 Tax=Nocardioides marmoriginsengisoli TaxID=661483 RepID=UPI00161E60B1|nr:MaoC family dehydratase N-terminal domain-containing protein [Nocardioides marmoriginsengisoli]
MDTRTRTQAGRSCIGRWTPALKYVVRRERLTAFAEAIGDTVPTYLRGDRAPLAFVPVAMASAFRQALAAVVPAKRLPRLRVRESDIRVRRHLAADDVVWTRARVIGMHACSSGLAISTQVETRETSGDLVVLQFAEAVVHDVVWPRWRGDRVPREDRAAGSAGGLTVVGEEARYGSDGAAIPELQTLAIAERAMVRSMCPDDPERLTRLACRFVDPGFSGDMLATGIWSTGDGRPATYGFEVAAGRRLLVRDGWAEVASPLPIG